MSDTFRAVWIAGEGNTPPATFRDVPVSELSGELLIRVEYSSLNYKDGLALTGSPGVIRKYPMIPGIDLAGVVVESESEEFAPGTRVVVTGSRLSETAWGGYAGMARVLAPEAVRIPEGFTTRQAMAIGTAGFTAMQAVMALERNRARPGGRDVVVTGAGGGVGSVAIALLSKLGYRVVASTGREELHPYLKSIGASEIIHRSILSEPSRKPLESERWGGAVDSVGGETLAGLLRTMAHGASIAVCGLAGGASLKTTVLPLILRGVNLLGVNSVLVHHAERVEIWNRLARDLDRDRLEAMTQEIGLSEVLEWGSKILDGQVRGRVVVDVSR